MAELSFVYAFDTLPSQQKYPKEIMGQKNTDFECTWLINKANFG